VLSVVMGLRVMLMMWGVLIWSVVGLECHRRGTPLHLNQGSGCGSPRGGGGACHAATEASVRIQLERVMQPAAVLNQYKRSYVKRKWVPEQDTIGHTHACIFFIPAADVNHSNTPPASATDHSSRRSNRPLPPPQQQNARPGPTPYVHGGHGQSLWLIAESMM
jgi:hypothetical protein